MTRTQAYRVLGLTEDADRAEIKSRYRQLMHKLHPDSRSEEKENYPYSAREINEAYGILVKGKGAKDSFIRRTKESTTSKTESRQQQYLQPLQDNACNPQCVHRCICKRKQKHSCSFRRRWL